MILSTVTVMCIKTLISELEESVQSHENKERILFEPAYQEYKNDLIILKKFWELEGEK